MDNQVRDQLHYLIRQYGVSLCEKPKQVEGMLKDLCPSHKKETRVLIAALQERVAEELLNHHPGIPINSTLERLERRLYEDLAIQEAAARWAVDSWALVLGVLEQARPGKAQAPPKAASPEPGTVLKLQAGGVFRDNLHSGGQGPEMVVIPGGKFMMGSPSNEAGRYGDEGPRHEVRVDGFAMGRYEVTVGEFRAFVKATDYQTEAERGDGCYVWTGSNWEKKKKFNWRNVGFEQNARHPVVCVSWNDAVAYTQWLSRETGKNYRLPTEAEWEYAARAGTQTPFHTGACISTDQANYHGNYPYQGCAKGEYRGKTVEVGSLASNAFGLYDMHGNVWEWTCSAYSESYNGNETICKNNANLRVLRGGSWGGYASNARSAGRNSWSPDSRGGSVGFRLARIN